jgi:16S rRNA (guanine(966)-N(2))-methyltransferase RsmD
MRVIAGKYKNRTLKSSDLIRPTSDRVRETLFNILQNEIEGSVFVDVFAGSGAVGIEALSRGASRVYFIETSRKALSALEWNLTQWCDEDQWRIYTINATKGLEIVRKAEPAVHVIFFDPPYAYRHYADLLQASADHFPDAIHVLEVSSRARFTIPEILELWKERKIGETILLFYRKRTT